MSEGEDEGLALRRRGVCLVSRGFGGGLLSCFLLLLLLLLGKMFPGA